MLRIIKTVNDLLVPQDQPGKDCWINLYMPTEAEITRVSEATGIPWDFISDPLDADERARIEADDDYLLIVVQAPIHNENNERVPYLTVPIGIIITPEVVVTVCRSSQDLVSQLLTIRPKNISTSQRMGFALNILMRTATHYLQALKELNRMTNEAEENLYKAMRNQELIHLLTINKSLVYFVTSLEANEMTMNRLLHSRLISLSEEESDILEDAITENRQAIGMASVYSGILSGMSDAFASIISNNMNTVMKMLTGVTIILTIPNIITSAYGMNIALPLQSSPFAFGAIAAVIAVVCMLVWTLFIKKRWL
ncbi:MAG: magnesium transporter CorA family protein [Desulfovibrionaceae bacterium]|nr:magnesium transporter CorA family protein [Desulfovibrionaceae bacterium]